MCVPRLEEMRGTSGYTGSTSEHDGGIIVERVFRKAKEREFEVRTLAGWVVCECEECVCVCELYLCVVNMLYVFENCVVCVCLSVSARYVCYTCL